MQQSFIHRIKYTRNLKYMLLWIFIFLTSIECMYIIPVKFHINNLVSKLITKELFTSNNLDLFLSEYGLKDNINPMVLDTRNHSFGATKLFLSTVLDMKNKELFDYNVQLTLELDNKYLEVDSVCKSYNAAAEAVAIMASEENKFNIENAGNTIVVFSCENSEVSDLNERNTAAVNECDNVAAIAYKDLFQLRDGIMEILTKMLTKLGGGASKSNMNESLQKYMRRCIDQSIFPVGTKTNGTKHVINLTKIPTTYLN
ncbi:hypothetical protein SLOPH_2124 [Spraguea lophii 42_110]|uniref:Uncharacterized protein n=1 Tax=Spraguea lophii (strain 42_110) TaxID=1358809 RepID=S7XS92_SPRLO|nr:hypothetical protein SLOPH_2124 [Spraguea lophii 42_110]